MSLHGIVHMYMYTDYIPSQGFQVLALWFTEIVCFIWFGYPHLHMSVIRICTCTSFVFASQKNLRYLDLFHCRYDERIDRVETRIAARLRDQLGTAKSANEMFRIFSRYNALFVRSHIRGAIREYQTQLIQRVKDDIESLHNKFKVSCRSSWSLSSPNKSRYCQSHL